MKKIKIFSLILLVGIGIVFFANSEKNYFKFSSILTAQISDVFNKNLEKNENLKTENQEKNNIESSMPEINAESAISVLLLNNGEKKILYQKNINERLSIASLTKLFTVDVFIENFDINQLVKISKKAVDQEGILGEYKEGEVFKAKDLIFSSLLESSNDAVYALAEKAGSVDYFVGFMNLKAKRLNLNDTYFINPTGLEENNNSLFNYSTANDLSKFVIYLIKNNPLILEIISKNNYDIFSANGNFHHKAINTNKFLESPYFFENFKLIGGKTGLEEKAGECLLLIFEDENNNYLINIVLNADNRFEESLKLFNKSKEEYNKIFKLE